MKKKIVLGCLLLLCIATLVMILELYPPSNAPVQNTYFHGQSTQHDQEQTLQVDQAGAGLELAKNSGCLVCHSLDSKVIGPAWKDVADQVHDRARIIKSIKEGSKGRWVEVVGENVRMPPYSPRVTDANVEILADFIMAL